MDDSADRQAAVTGDAGWEAAADRVCESFSTAWKDGDLGPTLRVLFDELTRMIPSTGACSLQIMEGLGAGLSYQVSERGVHRHAMADVQSAVAIAWREQRVVYRPDLAVDDPYDELWLLCSDIYGQQVRAVVDVPLRQGTLAANSNKPGAFSPEDIGNLQAIAGLLSKELDRLSESDRFWQMGGLARANAVLAEKNWFLTIFQHYAQTALSSPDLQALLVGIAAGVVDFGFYRQILISLVDDQTRRWRIVRQVVRSVRREDGINGVPVLDSDCSLDDGTAIAEAYRSGEVQVVSSDDVKLKGLPGFSAYRGKLPIYCLPAKLDGRVVAVLVVEGVQGPSRELERRISLFYSLLSQVMLNMEHSFLYHKLQQEVADRNVAEQELEKQRVLRIREDRLRSLGQMAAGIAHELGQPLVGVRGLAEYLLVAPRKGWDLTHEKIREKLRLIVDQADRMTHIIDHVRTFARDAGKTEIRSVDVNQVVESAVGLIGAQFRSRSVPLALELADGLPSVLGNPFSLEEVVINLLINARDATEERLADAPELMLPVIVVRTRAEDDGCARRVIVDVVDGGVGIDPDILSRVFDPFFSTKAPDQGTGLGLSISKSLVEQYGGTLHIQSTRGRGTTVTMALPSAPSPAA